MDDLGVPLFLETKLLLEGDSNFNWTIEPWLWEGGYASTESSDPYRMAIGFGKIFTRIDLCL